MKQKLHQLRAFINRHRLATLLITSLLALALLGRDKVTRLRQFSNLI